jgi:hypothetical protein
MTKCHDHDTAHDVYCHLDKGHSGPHHWIGTIDTSWPQFGRNYRNVAGYEGEVYRHEDTLNVDLWYPSVEGNPDKIQLALQCVRAADDIVITYDYERDGWAISRPLDPPDVHGGGDGRELAFIPAWDS